MSFNPNIIVSPDYSLPQVQVPESIVKLVLLANQQRDQRAQDVMYDAVRETVGYLYEDDDQRTSVLLELGKIEGPEAIDSLGGVQ